MGASRDALHAAQVDAGPRQRREHRVRRRIVADRADVGGAQPEPRAGEHRRGDLAARQLMAAEQRGLPAQRRRSVEQADAVEGALTDAHHVELRGACADGRERLLRSGSGAQ